MPLDELISQWNSDRPCERVMISWFLKVIEKCSVSDCFQIYGAILAYSIIYRKTDVLQVSCFDLLQYSLNYLKRQFKLTSTKRVHKHYEKITDDGQDVHSWEKPYIYFISRKYCSLALNHEICSEVYNHQLFSISINFTPKFSY